MAGDLEQDNWKTELKNRFPRFFKGVKILDIGSADMNGTNKPWFEDSEYIGLDIAPYKNVDVVSLAHEYDVPDESFDVVISTNHLEHDIYWEKTLAKMLKLLKRGGFMIIQTTHNRPEHGTKTKNPEDSLTVNFSNEEWADFFKHFSIEELKQVLNVDDVFSQYEISYQPEDERDVYFWGIKV